MASLEGCSEIKRPAMREYVAAALVLFLALLGSHVATPLYPLWQARLGLTTSDITLIFACYPIGVTLGLLYGGRLGDQIGRRPPLFIGLGLTALAAAAYLLAQSMPLIALARLTNGIAIGLLSGSAVAAIIELHPTDDRSAASRTGAVATLCSPAAGLLMATLIVHFLPPKQALVLPFLFQIVGLAVAGALVLSFRETIRSENRRSLRTASWRPQALALPAGIRLPFAFGALTAVLGWSITGLWLALGPAMAGDILGASGPSLGGMTVVAFLGTAALVQVLTKGLSFMRSILIALLLSVPGMALVLVTLHTGSAAGLVAGAAFAGCAQGLGWAGAAELVNRIAPASIRASVVSVLYICSYSGSTLPVIVTGFLADRIGLLSALTVLFCFYAVVIIVLLTAWFRFRGSADWAKPEANIAA